MQGSLTTTSANTEIKVLSFTLVKDMKTQGLQISVISTATMSKSEGWLQVCMWGTFRQLQDQFCVL